jgi:uncharacterized membrane protein YdjX (TVP38/TMEM64 family)/rhodanese-related sulfurtransferase
MKSKLFRFSLLVTLIIGIVLAIMYRDQLNPAALEGWVNEAGVAGPLVFILIYIIGSVFFLPGSVLTLAGGALFGPVLGTFYNLTGATIGAAISFLVARYLMSEWVEQKTGGRLKRLNDGVENEGWRFVAFVRLVPIFPFNILNYALGLTRIKFSHYVIATYICMLPGGFAYTYLGYVGREAVAGDESIIQKSLLALALLAAVAFLPRLISAMRKGPVMDIGSLKQNLDTGDDMLVLDVRAADDFVGEQGHIAKARNIAVEDLANRLDDLSDYAEKSIALVCRTDKRSTKAAQILSQNGFTDVHVVQGGMTAWNKAGYEVE